jgi:hypothetical protein
LLVGTMGQRISAWLCMSPCRSDHIFASSRDEERIWHMVSEDSACIRRPFLLIACTVRLSLPIGVIDEYGTDTQVFQHLARFKDSAVKPLSHDVLNPARVPL